MNSLIGCTGFVGSNLLKQANFDGLFNSKNISSLKNFEHNMIVIAAPSATKWKANQDPDTYFNMVHSLLKDLSQVRAKFVIHISTVDVYENPFNVDENTVIKKNTLHPYGQQRYLIEEFVRKKYSKHLIVRLPGLFGKNIKKNFIYDMMANNALNLTHKDSMFQLYDLDNLWKDINIAIQHNIKLINFATEPISAFEIASKMFSKSFKNITKNPPVSYNMKTIYSNLYFGNSGYIYSKQQIFSQLKKFISISSNYAS